MQHGSKRYSKMYACEKKIVGEFVRQIELKYAQFPDINFIQRTHYKPGVHLVIGLSPRDLLAEHVRFALHVADTLMENQEMKVCLGVGFNGIPEDGEFLLYDAAQALAIAEVLPKVRYNEFDTIDDVYLASFELEAANPEFQPEHWLEILCSYVSRCAQSNHQRKGLTALEQCEELLAFIARNFDFDTRSALDLVELIENVGYLYTIFELPERSVHIGRLYHPLIKHFDNKDTEIASSSLETEIEAWSDDSRELQRENNELRETALLLVNRTMR